MKSIYILVSVVGMVVLGCNPSPNVASQDAGISISIDNSIPSIVSELKNSRLAAEPTTTKDPRSQSQIDQAACTGADGVWRCPQIQRPLKASGGASTPTNPISWTVPHWYVSASTGSNSNTCTTIGAPCLDYATIVQRWGTTSPSLAQATIITFLSDNPSTDPVTAQPFLNGSGNLSIVGTLTSLATPTIGTFTAANHTTGAKPTITASGQLGAYWTPFVGMTVHDVAQNCQFYVDSDLGNATATITQGFTLPARFSSVFCAPANGDALTVYQPSQIYTGVVQTLKDSSLGTLTLNQLTINSDLLVHVNNVNMTECRVVRGILTSSSVNAIGMYSIWATGSPPLQGSASIFGGALNGAGSNFFSQSLLDGSVYLNGQVQPRSGVLILGNTYFSVTPYNEGFQGISYWAASVVFGPPVIWGPGTFNVARGAYMLVGGTAANVLKVAGGVTVDGLTTAFPWLPGSNAYGPSYNLTPTSNIDVNSGAWNPATGSKIVFTP
jgi:hypothetical protein